MEMMVVINVQESMKCTPRKNVLRNVLLNVLLDYCISSLTSKYYFYSQIIYITYYMIYKESDKELHIITFQNVLPGVHFMDSEDTLFNMFNTPATANKFTPPTTLMEGTQR